MKLVKIIALSGGKSNRKERLIQQGAVEVDQKPVKDIDAELTPGEYILRVGKKRFVKVVSKK